MCIYIYIYIYIVTALNQRYPPETGGVEFLDRPCSVGGFGGTGGGFRTGRHSGKPLLLPVLKKTPPVPKKPPAEQGRSKNSTPPFSGWYL